MALVLFGYSKGLRDFLTARPLSVTGSVTDFHTAIVKPFFLTCSGIGAGLASYGDNANGYFMCW